jgi:hypothetical protein
MKGHTMRDAALTQLRVNDDLVQVSTEIDTLKVTPTTPEQRRRAALTICEVMGRSGETAQNIRLVLQMLDLESLQINGT